MELDDAEQYYVGVGGLPNALGVVECDAAMMDHRKRYGKGGRDNENILPFTNALTYLISSINY